MILSFRNIATPIGFVQRLEAFKSVEFFFVQLKIWLVSCGDCCQAVPSSWNSLSILAIYECRDLQ